MAKQGGETWKCPTCSLERFPYGEPCPDWQTSCINMETPNINGEIYLRKLEPADWHPLNMRELAAISSGELLDSSQQFAIGIAAISDEDQKASKHDE